MAQRTDAIDRLIAATEERGLDFGMWSDRAKTTREFRYEVRVFGQADGTHDNLRVLERGSTPWEAAAKAADAVEADGGS